MDKGTDYRKRSTFSDENNILGYLRMELRKRIPSFQKNNRFENSIRNSIMKQEKWEDNSSKLSLPPDFCNHEDRIMMEVMRIDHYGYEDEKGNKRNPNTENINDLVQGLTDAGLEKILEQNIIIGALRDDIKSHEYGYTQYLENFKRIYGKHTGKIPSYRERHPGYKLIFLVFDESTLYYEMGKDEPFEQRIMPIGKITIHDPLIDEAFNSVLRKSDVDMVIWFSPFKWIDTNKGSIRLPPVRFYRMDYKLETRTFDPEKMKCVESKDSTKKAHSNIFIDGHNYVFDL